MTHLTLFDEAYASQNPLRISETARALVAHITTCKSAINILQRQRRESVIQQRNQQDPASDSESFSDQLRRKISQHEQPENQAPFYVSMFQNGLQWCAEHPWQVALGLLSCYVLYTRWTGGWPFNHVNRLSQQQPNQSQPAPARQNNPPAASAEIRAPAPIPMARPIGVSAPAEVEEYVPEPEPVD